MIIRDKRATVVAADILQGTVTKCERVGATILVHLDTGYVLSLGAEEWRIIESPQSA